MPRRVITCKIRGSLGSSVHSTSLKCLRVKVYSTNLEEKKEIFLLKN